VILIDPSPLQVDAPRRQLDVLIHELESHDPVLASRPRIVVVSKSELLTDGERRAVDVPKGTRFISALTGEGLDELLHAVADTVADIERAAPEREGFVLHRPLRDEFTIRRDGGEWVVEGIAATRAVNLADLTDPDAAAFVAQRLLRSGIVDALVEAGAQTGDDVRIGSIVFTFDPDPEEIEEMST